MIVRMFDVIRQLVLAVLSWIMFGPLTLVVPRRPHLYVFVGRDGGRFLDNCKYLFCSFQTIETVHTTAVFLTNNADLRQAIREKGGIADDLGGIRGMWMFLRAGTLVVDSVDWSRSWRFAASRGARVVQLWHGIPLKEIELALYRKQLLSLSAWVRSALRTYKKITGRFTCVDILLCTSRFIAEKAFEQCFCAKRISVAGYPRNDVLLADSNDRSSMIEINVDVAARVAIAKHRESGKGPVLLYAPTFRRNFADPFDSGAVDLRAISTTASELGLLVLIKLHPWMHEHMHPQKFPGIQFVAPHSDIYPILRDVDALVTDYSSIYFDYLLLDRPVIFFCHDLNSYIRNDRALLFDYQSITPGPKAHTTAELMATFRDIAAGIDTWSSERARVRSLVFDHVDHGASKRLSAELDCETNTQAA